MKMATGAGKTTVMAMLIAWQTANAVRAPGSRKFSKGFLIVTPGITIRDRLRVLEPQSEDSYYRTRESVPSDMIGEIDKAKIVITNYHAFKRRETLDISKVGRALLQGHDFTAADDRDRGSDAAARMRRSACPRKRRRHRRNRLPSSWRRRSCSTCPAYVEQARLVNALSAVQMYSKQLNTLGVSSRHGSKSKRCRFLRICTNKCMADGCNRSVR